MVLEYFTPRNFLKLLGASWDPGASQMPSRSMRCQHFDEILSFFMKIVRFGSPQLRFGFRDHGYAQNRIRNPSECLPHLKSPLFCPKRAERVEIGNSAYFPLFLPIQ